jgi:hypothetical protein
MPKIFRVSSNISKLVGKGSEILIDTQGDFLAELRDGHLVYANPDKTPEPTVPVEE